MRHQGPASPCGAGLGCSLGTGVASYQWLPRTHGVREKQGPAGRPVRTIAVISSHHEWGT